MKTPNARPTLFLSHGSPMMAIEPGAAGAFLRQLGQAMQARWGQPEAFVVVSPHTATARPVVLGAAQHDTIHDFGGFPPALYQVRYDTAGAPALAQDIQARLSAPGGPGCTWTDQGGLDHGIWTVLMHLHPQADVPVVPLSLTPRSSPAELMAMGKLLHELSQRNVQIIGSGSLTHNLQRFFHQPEPVDAPEHADCAAFRHWVCDKAESGQWDALLAYRTQAPHAYAMHPTDEHWLPFYLAAGAACGVNDPQPPISQRLFSGVTHGHLAMDAYAFASSREALEGLI